MIFPSDYRISTTAFTGPGASFLRVQNRSTDCQSRSTATSIIHLLRTAIWKFLLQNRNLLLIRRKNISPL
ncbi:hypothetical protein QE152_g30481 [Popillia japonica]|uniref:Uncharacterized protein n=1 Tax=Popillia japonica TaxID=7064 RepID=A0AAW1JDT2_POPJA